MNPENNLEDRFAGLLLGTAVGDSLGLPAEGLSRSRIKRRWHGVWRQRLVFGRGLCSDDTEHTIFVAQALLSWSSDPVAFQSYLGWQFRLWLLGLPAGVGLATLRAILKLWVGFPPNRSGVFSAGNGPAMRSAIIGAFFADDSERRRTFVSAATRITHTDPKAEIAARAIAEAAAWIMRGNGSLEELGRVLQCSTDDKEWTELVGKLMRALSQKLSTIALAESLGLNTLVGGYAYHSVPVALYAWLRHRGDFRATLESALNCGGDTDTVGAIAGALAGTDGGAAKLPGDWLGGIAEWPRTITFTRRIAKRLAEEKMTNSHVGPVSFFWPGLIPRNIIFLAIVLIHGFRRLAPPY